MRALIVVAVTVVPLLAFALAPEVEQAQKALEAGSADDVIGALEGAKLEGADRLAAANVLADAGESSLKQGDSALSLLLAQKALKLDPQNAHGLALATSSCRLE